MSKSQEKIKVGMVVRNWATDILEEYSTGVVVRIKPSIPATLPRYMEILWDDGTVAGEFEDELEQVLN